MFVQEAIQKGAAGVLVSEKIDGISKRSSVIKVPDTLKALGAVAGHHRRKFPIPLIAVTGSNGKTTTKEMIAHILSGVGPVLKNEGTKNNRVGVPLTLLGLDEGHRFAVLEFGMSERGEIGILSKIAQPTQGVITNIGPAHLALLKNLETVYSCKMEILEGLQKGGTLILNGDDLYLKKAASPRHRLLFFGGGTSFSASGIREEEGQLFFKFNSYLDAVLPLIGEHQVSNALGAIAAATAVGVEIPFAIERLKHFRGVNGRMTLKEIRGTRFIDDTYNANPESTRRALESLQKMPTGGKRIFILGDMLELGEEAEQYHAALGEKVITSEVDLFITVGRLSRFAHEKAHALGMNGRRSAHFITAPEAAHFLAKHVGKGDVVLVKGSRGMRMEELLKTFEAL